MSLPLILASTSPFRAQLLQAAGVEFTPIAPKFEEKDHAPTLSPAEFAKFLASGKAKSVISDFPDSLIIGSDQIFVLDGEIGGKPDSEEEAVHNLVKMRGKKLTFITAVCLLDTRPPETGNFGIEITGFGKIREEKYLLERTFVEMRSDTEKAKIEAYVKTGEGMNCAGGVMVEGRGAALVEEIQGDAFNLRGLPVLKVLRWLNEKGNWAF